MAQGRRQGGFRQYREIGHGYEGDIFVTYVNRQTDCARVCGIWMDEGGKESNLQSVLIVRIVVWVALRRARVVGSVVLCGGGGGEGGGEGGG